MKRFLAVLCLITAPAFAGPFEDLANAHNSGAPLASVMDDEPAERWESMFTEGRGVGEFTESRWHDDVGLARWSWVRGDESQAGWLALMTDKDGRIRNWYYTERGPKVNSALTGQAADGATTVAALSAGLTEANPLFAGASGPAIAAVKVGSTMAVQRWAPLDSCIAFSNTAGPLGWGAAVWNLGAIAGLGPVGVIPAVIVGATVFKKDEPLWDCLPRELL